MRIFPEVQSGTFRARRSTTAALDLSFSSSQFLPRRSPPFGRPGIWLLAKKLVSRSRSCRIDSAEPISRKGLNQVDDQWLFVTIGISLNLLNELGGRRWR